MADAEHGSRRVAAGALGLTFYFELR